MTNEERIEKQLAFFKEHGIEKYYIDNNGILVVLQDVNFNFLTEIPVWLFQNIKCEHAVYLYGIKIIPRLAFKGSFFHEIFLNAKVVKCEAFSGGYFNFMTFIGSPKISIGAFKGGIFGYLDLNGLKFAQKGLFVGGIFGNLDLNGLKKAVDGLFSFGRFCKIYTSSIDIPKKYAKIRNAYYVIENGYCYFENKLYRLINVQKKSGYTVCTVRSTLFDGYIAISRGKICRSLDINSAVSGLKREILSEKTK